MDTLYFSEANAKLSKLAQKTGGKVYSLDLPAGYTCPFALQCKSRAVYTEGKGKIVDGPKCVFRCYAASQETLYPLTYNKRMSNWDILRGLSQSAMVDVICSSIPAKATIVRLHSSGDFFSQKYFRAILEVCRRNPHILFYAYTKAVKWWVAHFDKIPPNLRLTASRGGKDDSLIDFFQLKSCKVVYSTYEARKLGLPIDINDSHAALSHNSFAVVIHGTQPKGTRGAKVWQRKIVSLAKKGAT